MRRYYSHNYTEFGTYGYVMRDTIAITMLKMVVMAAYPCICLFFLCNFGVVFQICIK